MSTTGGASEPSTTDTYALLLGHWAVERRFADYRLGLRGTFSGAVTVAPRGVGGLGWAVYRETGQVRIGERLYSASRGLHLKQMPEGTVAIFFEDGRAFVHCNLRFGRCAATHRCGEDTYEVDWRLETRDDIAERWRVLGPNKDYAAWTELRRTPACR